MKVCSFLPGSTQMIYALNLQDYLYGVTFECHSDKPKVVRSHIEGNKFSSEEINNIVSQSKAQGKSLYYIDEALLQEIEPDIIFTQDVCDVCQIDTAYVQRAIHKLKKKPLLVPLIPRSLDDVYQNLIDIASAMQMEEAAYTLLTSLKKRTHFIMDNLRKNKAPLRRVMLLEWIEPIYNCGHWIPYQIAQAGGVDMLSNPSGYSIVTPWEKIQKYNPEVLVIAPCGFHIERAKQELDLLLKKEGWHELAAVQNGAVYLADPQFFTQPGSGLVDGIEILAALFHPSIFEVPERLKPYVVSLKEFEAKITN